MLLAIIALSDNVILRAVHSPESAQLAWSDAAQESFQVRRAVLARARGVPIELVPDDGAQIRVRKIYTKNALEHALDDVRLVEVAAALDARGVRTCEAYTPGMDIRDLMYPRPRFMRAQLRR